MIRGAPVLAPLIETFGLGKHRLLGILSDR